MNRIRELRRKAGLDIDDVADAIDEDYLTVAIAEMGADLVHIDVAEGIAGVLDVGLEELFPNARHVLSEISSIPDDELEEFLLSRAEELAAAGIDPDPTTWYAILRLQSGNEMRYRISSAVKDRIRDALLGPGATGFFSFLADCRHVLVRAEAIRDLRFVDHAHYEPFSSGHAAWDIVLVSCASSRPEVIKVRPEGTDDWKGRRPFSDLLSAATGAHPMPSFLELAADGCERYVRLDHVELLEIPMGIVMPMVYADEVEVADGLGGGLEGMAPLGRA